MAYDTDTLYEPLSLNEGCSAFQSDFDSEKELTENLCLKIPEIIETFYEDKVQGIEVEKLFSLRELGLQNIRVDIYVTGEKDEYLIECKNPSQYVNEINIAVGQMLNYEIITRKAGRKPKMILATSDCEFILFEMIYKFKLPFDIILNNKEKAAVWRNEFI